MNIKEYVKDKLLFLLIQFILFVIISGIMLLISIDGKIIFLVFCIWFFPLLSYMMMEFIKWRRFYGEVDSFLDSLDQKYLLTEIVKEPDFIEGKVLYDVLKQANKDMHEHVKTYRDLESEYREYIETWVHEIKTPIVSTRLIIENNQNEVTRSINHEIKKIEEYIEQVLYYSRSNNVSKDFIIKKVSLPTLVRSVIKKNARDFISKGISVDVEDVEGTVHSDAKWLEFILNQVIGNSTKYIVDGNGKVKISTVEKGNNIVLTIEDNGIGIIEKDVNRVFEKGFTGENGRRFGRSTGIGLYLCKKLADQLGLGINLDSKAGKGTTVTLVFPLGGVNLIR